MLLSCIGPNSFIGHFMPVRLTLMMCSLTSRQVVMVTGCCKAKTWGFIEVLNRRATGFDIEAKNWQGPCAPRGVRGLKFYRTEMSFPAF